jgi:hypothetical protein
MMELLFAGLGTGLIVTLITHSYLIVVRELASRFPAKYPFLRPFVLQFAQALVPLLFALLIVLLPEETAVFLGRVTHQDYTQILGCSIAVTLPWLLFFGISMMKTISELIVGKD